MKRGRKERESLWAKWAAMYADGMTLHQIASAEGVPFSRVYYGLRGMGAELRRGRPRLGEYQAPSASAFNPSPMELQRIARMEELAYRIAKRRVRLIAPIRALFGYTSTT